MRRIALGLVVLALILSACQPIVLPEEMAGMELTPRSGTVMGDVDFTVPDWGLAEGWVHFEVEQVDAEQETAQGTVRWVEYNDAGELRYVVAEPACIAFGPDGHTAMIAVQIDHRYGWGDGDSGQWMQFWVNDAGPDGQAVFASPLFPAADENPGCELITPEFQIEPFASDLVVRGPGAGAMMDTASAQQAAETLVNRYLEELWNQGNLDVADELVAESFVSHNAPPGEGLGFLKEIVAGYKASNPNIYFTGGEVVLTENGVIAAVTMMERPEGAPADAEGEQIGDPMMVILDTRDGKITDRWLFVPDE